MYVDVLYPFSVSKTTLLKGNLPVGPDIDVGPFQLKATNKYGFLVFTMPLTSRVYPGVVVPMPTLPEESMRRRSVFPVASERI